MNQLADITQSFANLGSQIGDERPISLVRFSPNSKYLATGSWAGNVKLWDMPNCTPVRTFRGRTDRVGGVAWHPQATLSQSEDVVNMVSGAADQTVNLWSLNRYVARLAAWCLLADQYDANTVRHLWRL